MPIKIASLNPYSPAGLRIFRGTGRYVRATLLSLKKRRIGNCRQDRNLRTYSTRTIHHALGVGVQFAQRRTARKAFMPVFGARIGYLILDPMGDGDGREYRRLIREAKVAWTARMRLGR